MPAYFESGFSVREPMWHGLGTILKDYPGREEAMRVAGHDFTLVEKRIAAVDVDADGNTIQRAAAEPITGYKALVRHDTNATVAVVKDSYTVLQNDRLWDVLDALVNEPNVKYETAGVLKGGTILWALAKLDEPRLLKTKLAADKSPIYPFVSTTTRHDGKGALVASRISVRIVCWNTFSAAMDEASKTGFRFTFRHVGDVMTRIEEARDVLNGVRDDFRKHMDELEELLGLPVSKKQRELFLSKFIPTPPESLISDRVAGNIESARQTVRAILASPTCEGVENTAYGLVQAATEYLDYFRRSKNQQTQFRRSLLKAQRVKNKATVFAREAANA